MTDQSTPAGGVDDDLSSASETDTADELWAEFDAADTEKAGQPSGKVRVSEVNEEGDDTPDDDTKGGATSKDPDLKAGGSEVASAKADTTANPEDQTAQIERLKHQLKSEQGRTAAQQRKLDELQKRITTSSKDLTERKRDHQASTKRSSAIDKAQKDFPDAVGPVADELKAAQKREAREIARQEEQLEADRKEAKALLIENQKVFQKEHPDGFDVIKDNWDAFKDWIEDQPKAVRDGFEKNRAAVTDPLGAAHMVALFKREISKAAGKGGKSDPDPNPTPDSKRKRQLEGAQAPRNKAPLRTQNAPSEDASAEDQWAYFEELDRQKERANR
jgi:hypothetical protein